MSTSASGVSASGVSVSGSAQKGDLHDLLPQTIKDKGVLTVAIDPSAPPNEFKDGNNQIVGLDPDLMAAITKVLGIKLQFTEIKFDGILASLKAKRVDMAASDFSVTADRMKVVDFITYMNATTTVLVKKGNPVNIKTVLDLCGKKVSVLTASSQADKDLPDISAQCAAAGKPAVIVLSLPSEQNAIQAVTLGRVDAEIDDNSVAAYQAQLQPDAVETVPGMAFAKAPVGFPFPKGSAELEAAISGALVELMKDGTYKMILDKWGAGAQAIARPELNPVGS